MGSAVSATTPPRRPRALTSRGPLPLLGPAFVAAIAYVDPGNFATNITAGSTYGYLLVWVLLVSNAMAMLIQYLSAKAGIATGLSLPELCREHFPRRVNRGLWAQAEVVAIATDLAEVLGGAIALQLLFGATAARGRRDHRGGRVRPAGAAGPRAPPVRDRDHRPARGDPARLLLQPGRGRHRPAAPSRPELSRASTAPTACCWPPGMLGATVMPHVIYLHGALTQGRYARDTETPAAARCCAASGSTWSWR